MHCPLSILQQQENGGYSPTQAPSPALYGLVETKLLDPAASMALVSGGRLSLGDGGHHDRSPSRFTSGILLVLLSGSKEIMGDEAHPGIPHSQQVSCDKDIQALHRYVRENVWFISVDFKDANSHVPILKAHREFICFAFMGMAYKYPWLPFSYTLARALSRSAWRQHWSRSDVRKNSYLDDLLVLSRSEEASRMDTMAVFEHISLGIHHQLGEEVLVLSR